VIQLSLKEPFLPPSASSKSNRGLLRGTGEGHGYRAASGLVAAAEQGDKSPRPTTAGVWEVIVSSLGVGPS
jgi:hypothetical protein